MSVSSSEVKRVLVVGLDSATWPLLEKERENLPNLWRFFEKSLRGVNRSTVPALTVPAWASMTTGLNPGELGFYGFRNRPYGRYQDFAMVDSTWVYGRRKAVWDYLGDDGKRSVVFAVPPDFPPAPVRGIWVSGFMTPVSVHERLNAPVTNVEGLGEKLASLAGGWWIDVNPLTTPAEMKEELWNMTQAHFEAVRYLVENEDWTYFHFVEIGFDRVHHLFWRFYDETHHNYPGRTEWQGVIPDYYRLVDREFRKLMELVDLDDTAVVVVSDHGMKAMRGGFIVNEFLEGEGFLKFRNLPEKPRRMTEEDVLWNRTEAWAWGGFYARVFLNMVKRERSGVVSWSAYERLRDEVAEAFRSVEGPDGKWDTKVYYPEEEYGVVNGWAPDLMVYLDDLNWRSLGSIGHGRLFVPMNDTRPDDAVHSMEGMIAIRGSGVEPGLVQSSVYDFLPTVLDLLGYRVEGAHGESLLKKPRYEVV